MNQTIDVACQTNEDTEISNRFDGARYFVALLVGDSEIIPRIRLALFHAEADTTTLFVDLQNHNFHFIAQLHNF